MCTKHNTNKSMHKQHSNPPSIDHGSGFRKVRMVPIILFTSLRHLFFHILNLDNNTYIEKHHNSKPHATSVLFYAIIQRQHKLPQNHDGLLNDTRNNPRHLIVSQCIQNYVQKHIKH
jgi:hypothetical protein